MLVQAKAMLHFFTSDRDRVLFSLLRNGFYNLHTAVSASVATNTPLPSFLSGGVDGMYRPIEYAGGWDEGVRRWLSCPPQVGS